MVCQYSQGVLQPDLDGPVHRAGEEYSGVMRVPGHLPDGGGVGGVHKEGVGGAGDGTLKHHTCVHTHHHHCDVVRSECHGGCHSCNTPHSDTLPQINPGEKKKRKASFICRMSGTTPKRMSTASKTCMDTLPLLCMSCDDIEIEPCLKYA